MSFKMFFYGTKKRDNKNVLATLFCGAGTVIYIYIWSGCLQDF